MEAEQAVADLERFLTDRGDQPLRTAAPLAGSKEAARTCRRAQAFSGGFARSRSPRSFSQPYSGVASG